MQRYFASTDKLGNIVISKDDIFHITKVMRMKIGDKFEINNDGNILLCEVTSIGKSFEYKIIEEKKENHELNGFIRLLYCLPKGDKIDLVIQKSVELGVKEIVLINSERSIAKITSSNKESKLTRFNKIIKEASEQSKRTNLMKLEDVISFDEISKYDADIKLIAYENTLMTSGDLTSILKKCQNKVVNIIIGAEGGISKTELDISKKCGYQEISLGKRILRSETACIYIISLLSFYMEQ